MTSSHGTPSWVDLGSPRPELAEAFYSSLLGWTVSEPDGGGYQLCSLDGRLVGALGPGSASGDPYWTTYFNVSGIEAATQAIVDAGGVIVEPPSDAPGLGSFAVATDPGDAPITLWQPLDLTGAAARSIPGAWARSHLITSDRETASAFYASVFGWHETGSGWSLGGAHVATASAASRSWMPARPSLWLVIFQAADLEASRCEAVRLGGTERGSLDHPEGPTLLFIDDQNTVFGLCAGPAQATAA